MTVEEIDGCSSNVGRARLAEDFRDMHGPDPESCGRAREPREVAHIVRRRTSLKTWGLLRKLAGDCSRSSGGAVTQTSDRHTRHSVASVPVKRLEQPLRHTRGRVPTRLREYRARV